MIVMLVVTFVILLLMMSKLSIFFNRYVTREFVWSSATSFIEEF